MARANVSRVLSRDLRGVGVMVRVAPRRLRAASSGLSVPVRWSGVRVPAAGWRAGAEEDRARLVPAWAPGWRLVDTFVRASDQSCSAGRSSSQLANSVYVACARLIVERRLNPARAVWVAPFIGGMFAAMVAGLARL